jgi:hypothetical protein
MVLRGDRRTVWYGSAPSAQGSPTFQGQRNADADD